MCIFVSYFKPIAFLKVMSTNNSFTSSSPPPPPSSNPANKQKKIDVFNNNLAYTTKDFNIALSRLLSTQNCSYKIYHLNNVDIKPQLQEGPKCGLVALSIASTIHENPTSVEILFDKALSLGYTKQGEIFSAEFLADLAEKCCRFKTEVLAGGLHEHFKCINQHLLNKNLVLLPYDADRNHQPCLQKGFKAHWAVISGIAILSECQDFRGIEEKNDVVVLEEPPGINYNFCKCLDNTAGETVLNFTRFHGKILLSKGRNGVAFAGKPPKGEIYLIGRQGKSRHYGFWPFHKTASSNDNLFFFSADRNREEYVLPVGGPSEGLRGKAVILKKLREPHQNR